MENSLKLQMDVKNNAEDLRRYMLDLQTWEEEMNRKELGLKSEVSKASDIPPPRNIIKRNTTNKEDKKQFQEPQKKPKKIHAYDYSSWDKYDADAACAELEKEPEGKPKALQSNTQKTEDDDEEEEKEKKKEEVDNKSNLQSLDEAFYEKELGNQFVRREKWEDALKCYTRAIELDSRNGIYYANRALCFAKLKNFRSAEVDATVAIQLDNTYVKAYHRRAFARVALGQIEEALSDYREIVKLEPNNAYAKSEICKLEKRLNSNVSNVKEVKKEKKIFDHNKIFKSDTKKESSVKSNQGDVKEKKTDEKKEEQKKEVEAKVVKERSDLKGVKEAVKETKKVEELKVEKPPVKEEDDLFGQVPDGFTIVQPVHVPPHLRSKKPLRRIPVEDVTWDRVTFPQFISMRDSVSEDNVKTKKAPENTVVKITQSEAPDAEDVENFPKPETFLQFQQVWKIVKKNPQRAFNYLEITTPKTLYKILRHNLESDLFSELMSVLSSFSKTKSEFVYSVLCELTGVDRYGSLILFFSESDKENFVSCIEGLKSAKTEREIHDLRKFYQL